MTTPPPDDCPIHTHHESDGRCTCERAAPPPDARQILSELKEVHRESVEINEWEYCVRLLKEHATLLLSLAERAEAAEKDRDHWKKYAHDFREDRNDLASKLNACSERPSEAESHLEVVKQRLNDQRENTVAAEARVRELEAKCAEQRALLDQWNAVSEKGDDELSKAAGLMKEMRERYTDLESRLKVAETALEKIGGYYNEYQDDIGRALAMKKIATDALAAIRRPNQ